MFNKKAHIHQHRIPLHSEQWHQFRYDNGIGASEISSVMATISKNVADLVYVTPIQWHLSKIGEPTTQFSGNVASESGHFFEPIILKWYKYYDMEVSDQMDMFRRMKENSRVNRAMSPKSYYTNDKYPGFFCSPDAFGWPGMVKKKVYIEIKNTTSFTADKFVNKVDPGYYLQVQTGLMITELEEAHLLILVDGRFFEIVTVYADKEIQQLILKTGSEMWKKVVQARILKLQYDLPSYYGINHEFLTDRQKEGAMLLSELEPSLIGTEDELKFVQEMVKPREEDVEMQGSEELKQVCIDYKNIGEEKKLLDKQANLKKAEMILALGGFNKAVFDDESFFTYKADSNKVMRLYISPKVMKSNDL